MAFDINNFVIDRIVRGIATNTSTGEIMFSINQIENPTLNCASEETNATDALGATIMSFERAKSAEFSAENSLFDLGLLATQMGGSKQIASAGSTIATPKFETVDITTGMTSYVLAETPLTPITAIYGLKGDSTLGTKYTANTVNSATEFVYTSATHTITLPTGLTVGSQIFIMYEYAADSAVAVTNSAVAFPKSCKFIMQVLGADICDPSTLVYAYLIFPNCKLSSAVDLTFTTEGKHPFSMKANQAYCDKTKKLFQIIVPEA